MDTCVDQDVDAVEKECSTTLSPERKGESQGESQSSHGSARWIGMAIVGLRAYHLKNGGREVHGICTVHEEEKCARIPHQNGT